MADNENIKPRVSFCMTTYKRPEILKATLGMISQQTFTDFEVIISDNDVDNSDDSHHSSL